MTPLGYILLNEGSGISCPNCGDYLGKMSEVEANASEHGQNRNKKIEIFCGNCGKTFKHITQYDTREAEEIDKESLNEDINLAAKAKEIKQRIQKEYIRFLENVHAFASELEDKLNNSTNKKWDVEVIQKTSGQFSNPGESKFAYGIIAKTEDYKKEKYEGFSFQLTTDRKDGYINRIDGRTSKWHQAKIFTANEAVKAIKELMAIEQG